MTRAAISRLTTDGSSAAAALELIAPASFACFLRSLTLTLSAATASIYGLGRPAAKGITPTSPVQLLATRLNDSGGLCQTATALAWGTGPTAPSAFYARVSLAAAIGQPVSLWDCQDDDASRLFIPAGGSLVLWNLAANSVANVVIIVDEVTTRGGNS